MRIYDNVKKFIANSETMCSGKYTYANKHMTEEVE